MPTYQYYCDACSLDFEASRSFTDSSDQLCPDCQGVARKVFAPVGVHFKGSGFYRTDSRSNKGSSGEGGSGSSSSST
ncbi:MAG: FmdB family transcriptional regulator, partial [Actinobacteria bacterium]|nr:FmdB family transcriptional regulator [Actinomycetota bacterium]